MRLVPLAGRPEEALRDALLSHGWEGDLARSTAAGVEPFACEITDLAPEALEALVHASGRLGLELVTGPDWALLAGPRVRLSALARPWTVAEPLAGLAAALGHCLPADEPHFWQTAGGPIELDRPVIIGILNLTPDSFSDGGRYSTTGAAVERAGELLDAGADVLDLGGESTRPGAEPVPEAEQIRRVMPALETIALRYPGVPLSIDTTRAAVARAALDRGAAIVNDVSGLRHDAAMAPLCAERGAGVVVMHSRGPAGTLAATGHADYADGVLTGVTAELAGMLGTARAAGIAGDRLVVDPGLGFGKTAAQNVELLRGLPALRALGRPLLVGPSRKRFLGELTGRDVAGRDHATGSACALAWATGARLFRVHEPGPVRDALAVARAMFPR